MSHGSTCTCARCGAAIPSLPLDYAYQLPDCVFAVPPEDRSPRCNEDFAELGDRRFVRALLPVPVEGGEEFRYGLWLEVDADTFYRVAEVWNEAGPYLSLEFAGRVANAFPPIGPEAVGVLVEAAARTARARPFVVSSDTSWMSRLLSCGWTRAEYVQHATSMSRQEP